MNYYQTPPFEKFGKRVVFESDNMYKTLQKDEERPWYTPNGFTSRLGSKALSGLFGAIKGVSTPYYSGVQPSAITTSDGIKMSDSRISRFGKIMAKSLSKRKKKLPKSIRFALAMKKKIWNGSTW